MDTERVAACTLCANGDIECIDEDRSIGRCRACGFVLDLERPTPAEIERYYSDLQRYDTWLAKEVERNALWKRRLQVVLRYCRGGALLDVGAGIGQFLHFARQHFEVAGTEVSASAIEIAREKYGLVLQKGSVEEMHFGSAFDVVTLYHVLEHVPDPSATIRRCASLLKPGGILVVAVPNDVSTVRPPVIRLLRALKIPWARKRSITGLPRLVLDGSLPEIHMSHFTAPVLKQFLAGNGFQVLVDSLDRYYAESGAAKLKHDLFYFLGLAVKRVFGANVYATILTVARKKGPAASLREIEPTGD